MDKERLFREVGEVILLAQGLEVSLGFLISILNRHFHTGISEKKLILAEDRRTLGRLIKELKKHGEPNQEFAETLGEALEARNYIAHEFFVRNIYVFTSEPVYRSALTLLDKRTKMIAKATAVTNGLVQGFCKALKIKSPDLLMRQDIQL